MILWVDLETTGLEDFAEVLEIALVITEDDLTAVDTFTAVRPLPYPLIMDDFVRNMHTVNGLLAECIALLEKPWAEIGDNASIDKRMLRFLQKNQLPEGKVELAGSGVHFDRRMMHLWFPKTEAWCHYRNIDVSTIRTCLKKWAPGYLKHEPDPPHRALPDILHTISECKIFKDQIFAPLLKESRDDRPAE